MIVYRVENSEGLGPYRGHGWHPTRHMDKVTHPNPNWDEGMVEEWHRRVGNHYDSQYVFGFESMDQLNAWFNDQEMSDLMVFGYSIVAFEVADSDVIIGRKQLAFVRATAKILEFTQGAA